MAPVRCTQAQPPDPHSAAPPFARCRRAPTPCRSSRNADRHGRRGISRGSLLLLTMQLDTRSRLLAAALACLAVSLSGQTPPPTLGQKLGTNDPAREKRLEWFREAKYGMFIHWGLYAIPAGEYKGRRAPGIGEWIMNRLQIPVAEYEQLAKQFNPVKFNPDEWVQLAQDAGMKYMVI